MYSTPLCWPNHTVLHSGGDRRAMLCVAPPWPHFLLRDALCREAQPPRPPPRAPGTMGDNPYGVAPGVQLPGDETASNGPNRVRNWLHRCADLRVRVVWSSPGALDSWVLSPSSNNGSSSVALRDDTRQHNSRPPQSLRAQVGGRSLDEMHADDADMLSTMKSDLQGSQ